MSENLMALVDRLDRENPTPAKGYAGDHLHVETDEWERISKALRLAIAWLEIEQGLDAETVEENFHKDDLFDKLGDAREAFRQAIEGGGDA